MSLLWILRNRVLNPYYWEKKHEPDVRKKLLGIEGDVFWDVGADVGTYSLLLRRNFEQVYAVEPNPITRKRLRARVIWNLAWNVEIVPLVLSDSEKQVDLEIRVRDNDNYFNTMGRVKDAWHDEVNQHVKQVIRTTARPLDLVAGGIIDLLKIDVEGAEFQVLNGARLLLGRHCIRKLLVELHNLGRRKELEDFVTGYGFNFSWLDNELTPHLFAELR